MSLQLTNKKVITEYYDRAILKVMFDKRLLLTDYVDCEQQTSKGYVRKVYDKYLISLLNE